MEKETIVCKYCQTEIPKKAKVCPQCRKKQGGVGKWIAIVLVILFIFSVGSGGNFYELSEDATTMTKEEYTNACQEVTYEELARSNES